MRQTPLRSKIGKGSAEISSGDSSPAPVKGWNTRDPLAKMQNSYAVQLDNWWPTAGAVEVRYGADYTSTGFSGATKTIAAWKGTASSKLFAMNDTGIYDITAGGVIGASVQARTEGYCCTVNFATSGSTYLVVVNGVDDLVYTNGTTWTTVANFSINGGGTLLTKDISNINAFKRSLFYIEKNSMNFYYLPIDSITGTVSKFPLGGLFTRGGKLVAMGTWTVDGGAGPEDYSAFITSEGQMAIYWGTDPSTIATWSLKGIFDVDPPNGQKCFCKLGGDLLVLTRRGLLSLTESLRTGQLDPSKSLSGVIGEAFLQASSFTGDKRGWEMIEQPEFNALIVNVPQEEFVYSHQYVMNTRTGAWTRFKGWDGFCMCYYNKVLYMGMTAKVAHIWRPGNDFGGSITAEARTAYDYYQPRARIKSWKLLRPNLLIAGIVAVNVGLDTDFQPTNDYGQAVFNTAATSRWDASSWDADSWASESVMKLEWITVAAKESYCAAVRLRVIMRDATIAWSATDMIFEEGSLL